MKNIVIILCIVFSFFSCKGTSQENETKIPRKQENSIVFNKVETTSSTQNNSLFTFNDKSSLFIELVNTSQYIKLNNQLIFLSKSVLESANTLCYLYSYKAEKIIILEGNDYYAGVFYVYYFDKENLYEIGTFDLDYPNIEEDIKSEEVDFKVEKESNKILIQIFKNNKLQKKEAYIVSDKEVLKKFNNEKDFISYLMQENLSTPDWVINYLVFKRDAKNNLKINTEILDYISKNTTKENSSYLFALEKYHQKYYNKTEKWNSDDFVKIQAYIFNTTYPLRKKYWSDKYEEWYNGKPEYLLGSRGSWQDNDYYGLPHLKEYVEDFIVTYW